MNEFIEKVSGDEYFQELGLENIKELSMKSFLHYTKHKNIHIQDLTFIKLDDMMALFRYNI
jgi:hypothetical protein